MLQIKLKKSCVWN